MTVKDFINELEKIDDKNQELIFISDDTLNIYEINHIYCEHNEATVFITIRQ